MAFNFRSAGDGGTNEDDVALPMDGGRRVHVENRVKGVPSKAETTELFRRRKDFHWKKFRGTRVWGKHVQKINDAVDSFRQVNADLCPTTVRLRSGDSREDDHLLRARGHKAQVLLVGIVAVLVGPDAHYLVVGEETVEGLGDVSTEVYDTSVQTTKFKHGAFLAGKD